MTDHLPRPKPRKNSTMKKILFTLPALMLSCSQLFADVVYITSRPTPSGTGANANGTYTEVNFPTLGDFGSAGIAAGRPPTSGAARTYITSAVYTDTTGGVNLTPTLGVPGGVYQIDYNFSSTAGNTSTNIVMAVTATSATLSFSTTDKLQRQYGNPANVWRLMGYVTNDVGSATPSIQFRYQSGQVSGAGTGAAANRLIFDCWRFTLVEPCLAIPTVSVTGPLSTNLNEVVVAGVSASATNVFVYQNSGAGMVLIGAKTSGVTSNNNTVTVSGLVKGAIVAATQKINGQEGCTPSTGTIVGGGANPSVRIALTIRETTSTGPAGLPGDNSSVNLHFLNASAVSSGAPINAGIVYPSNSWQTVSFLRGTNEIVGDSANAAGATVGAAGYAANDTVSIQVFAYKILPNGITIYSASGAISAPDVTSNDVFTVNWTWDAVPGAQGYRILRNYNFSGFNEYQDVAANTLSDANTGWAAGSTVSPTTAQPGRSVQWNPAVSNTNNLPGSWGILESINFAISGLDDTGPFDLYIDNLQSGSSVFQTFEEAPAKITDYGFRSPSFSGTTSGNILTAPDVGQVANNVADTGTKSFHIRFQWVGTNSTRWLRLTTSGVNNPQVNLDEPISFRLLFQPVNATLPTPPTAPTLTLSQPGNATVLNWPGGHRLQTAVDVTGTYTNVPQSLSGNTWTNVTLGGFLGPWTNHYTEPTRFFRLAD